MDGLMQIGVRKLGYASCTLGYTEAIPNLRLLEISNVFTEEHRRGEGFASKLINKICDEADEAGVGLILMPDTSVLESWYKTFGFVTIQTEPATLMARSPKGTFSG